MGEEDDEGDDFDLDSRGVLQRFDEDEDAFGAQQHATGYEADSDSDDDSSDSDESVDVENEVELADKPEVAIRDMRILREHLFTSGALLPHHSVLLAEAMAAASHADLRRSSPRIN